MASEVSLSIDGRRVTVPAASTVAAAIFSGGSILRRSVTGEPRAALCGMGICFECRVRINGRAHVRACQVVAEDGMEVETG